MERTFTVDRVESGIAVCIDDETLAAFQVPAHLLPDGREGARFALSEEGKMRALSATDNDNKERLNMLFKSKGDN